MQAVVAGGSSCGWCGWAAGCETVAEHGLQPALACPPFWHSRCHPKLCEEEQEPHVHPSSFWAPPSLRSTVHALCISAAGAARTLALCATCSPRRALPRGALPDVAQPCARPPGDGDLPTVEPNFRGIFALDILWSSASRLIVVFLSLVDAARRTQANHFFVSAVRGRQILFVAPMDSSVTTDTTVLHSTRARSISVWTPWRILGRGNPSWSPPKRACSSPTYHLPTLAPPRSSFNLRPNCDRSQLSCSVCLQVPPVNDLCFQQVGGDIFAAAWTAVPCAMLGPPTDDAYEPAITDIQSRVSDCPTCTEAATPRSACHNLI